MKHKLNKAFEKLAAEAHDEFNKQHQVHLQKVEKQLQKYVKRNKPWYQSTKSFLKNISLEHKTIEADGKIILITKFHKQGGKK